MKFFLDALKILKPWQIGLLAFVLAGAGGTTYGVYTLVTRPAQESPGENQQLIPVQYGDLVNQVSINGSLLFPTRETLTFGTQGTVSEVLVEEGQQVKKGQTLATLDSITVATLNRAVAQARVTLRDAGEALEKAKDPHTALELAQAEANVANAKLTLKNAEDTLDKLLMPTSQEMAQAKTAVTNANLSVKNAQEVLDALKSGPADKDIAKVQGQIDQATVNFENALRDLLLAREEWDGKLKTAQDAKDTAIENYRTVLKKWFGVETTEEALAAPETLLNSWGVDLTSFYDPDARYQNIVGGGYTTGFPRDDLATPWNEVTVYTWLNFFPGRIQATCEGGVVAPQGVCVQKELDDSWDIYDRAVVNLDTVKTQGEKAVASAESAVTRNEESLASAKDTMDDLMEKPDSLEIASKENLLALALATVDKAEEDLAKLDDGPEPLEVEAKKKQVAVAKASLAKAEEDWAELKGSVDALLVALREAEVASAQQALETAIQRLEDAVLESPLTGIVSLVNIEAGQVVNSNTPVVEIVDPAVVEVDGIVDEIDVLFIREGSRAAVSMDALPGQTLQGTVSSITLAARTQQGVVSYPISIRLQVPAGLDLREGLSATAAIVLREDRNVLLVPVQALYGSFQQPVVKVMVNGHIEERPVVLGNSDDFWVIVTQGLSEGDRVVTETNQTTTSQFGLGGGFRQFQGQFPGTFPGTGAPQGPARGQQQQGQQQQQRQQGQQQ